MTITIVGAGSTVARTLIPILLMETDANIQLLSSRVLPFQHPRVSQLVIDITDRTALKDAIMLAMPSVIINTAAMTNVDKCESERNTAWQLNVTLVEHLVRISRLCDAHLVHFSTDYVFDGAKGPYSETDIPAPISYYGKSKLAGENVCMSANIPATIIRTNVVYGPSADRPDFVRWVFDAFEADTPINVVTDQYSNPTYVEDIAESVLQIITRTRTGIYHVGGSEYLNRYDFACKIADVFKANKNLLVPITTDTLQQAAKRPLKGGLITLKAETDLVIRFRSIEAGLVSLRHAMFANGESPRIK